MTRRFATHRPALRHSNDAGLWVILCSFSAAAAVDPAVLSSLRNWLIYVGGCLLAGVLAYATPARRVPVSPPWRSAFMVFAGIMLAAALRGGRWSQALAVALPAVGAAVGHQLLMYQVGVVQTAGLEKPLRPSWNPFSPAAHGGGILGLLGRWALLGIFAGLALAFAVSLITNEHNPGLLQTGYFQLYEGLCVTTFGLTLALARHTGKSGGGMSDLMEFLSGLVAALVGSALLYSGLYGLIIGRP